MLVLKAKDTTAEVDLDDVGVVAVDPTAALPPPHPLPALDQHHLRGFDVAE